MEPLANLNGKQMPLADVMIPALDRGFLFGDAVYEVMRVYQGRLWLEEGHWERLARSLSAIRIPNASPSPPGGEGGVRGVDLARLRQRVLATIAAGPFLEATVYVQITRGVAPRAHAFPANAVPLEFLYVKKFKDPYAEFRQTGAAVITLPDIRWDHCDIKSTNLLANILAAQAAKEAGCQEALLYLPDGTLTEGTHTSFFGVLNGSLLTAPTTPAILPGITRGLILRLAQKDGIPVQEHVLKRDDLKSVSELFLTGTTTEILPITRVDGHPVADGKPGPISSRLQAAYANAIAEFVR
jgi:D-alanine transaminase